MSTGVLPSTVTGDHSLDDFLDAGGSEESADDPANAPTESDAELIDDEQHATDLDSVEPAEPTYDWSPDGTNCATCGESATTRWRQDDEYVCADCKEW